MHTKSYSPKATYTSNGRMDNTDVKNTEFGIMSYVKEIAIFVGFVSAAVAIVSKLF